MFTGIIEELGVVRGNSSGLPAGQARHNSGGQAGRIAIEAGLFADAGIGDSICVNGSCLTVAELKGGSASFDLSIETRRRTNLGELRPGCKVNLERALKIGARLGGHFVSGHVDCIGKIRKAQLMGMEIEIPSEFMKYVTEKGSVTVDGVSLTASDLKSASFAVYLIPHTLNATTLASKKAGDSVNVEVDMLAKYVEKFVAGGQGITAEFLKEHGLA